MKPWILVNLFLAILIFSFNVHKDIDIPYMYRRGNKLTSGLIENCTFVGNQKPFVKAFILTKKLWNYADTNCSVLKLAQIRKNIVRHKNELPRMNTIFFSLK